jgi:hypothetical protein
LRHIGETENEKQLRMGEPCGVIAAVGKSNAFSPGSMHSSERWYAGIGAMKGLLPLFISHFP